MTTTARFQTSGTGVSFIGLLNSEWIKLRSLRSTVWCYSIVLVISIAIGLLVALTVASVPSIQGGNAQALVATVITVSILFSQLVVGVLGALVITGEFGTGMIRSTFAASPRRFITLLSKAVVLTVITFVVGFVSLLLTCLVASPILSAVNITPDYSDGRLWGVIIGGAGYLALVSLVALAIGTLLRSSAGAISATLGIYFVIPIIVDAFSGILHSQVLTNIGSLLPRGAGSAMFAYASENGTSVPGLLSLDPFQGFLVSLAWVVVLGGIASVVLKRRDV